MGWSGDLSQMDRLTENLGQLSAVPSRVARRVSDAIESSIQAQFDAGEDPYGTRWEPLRPATIAKGRTEPPLTDTHAMRDSLHVFPMQDGGVAITIDHPAQVHQTGGEAGDWQMDARPILPGKGFPSAWEEIIGDAVADEINHTLQGRS